MALSLRSSFRDTLVSLDISQVTITEDDLIHSIASLTSLECLMIADQHPHSSVYHTLVTDALLRRLTLIPDIDPAPRLVPRLKYLSCTSVFQFNAHLYFNFITSRVMPGMAPFHGVLRRYHGVTCNFDSVVHQKLLDLETAGGIRFQLEG
ncbi:hypothetical protein C8R43DRAFT_505232 [Mycena crocata]|nr:hypothetical protein C8R43DRAFT_505232 [Mycena crocata]